MTHPETHPETTDAAEASGARIHEPLRVVIYAGETMIAQSDDPQLWSEVLRLILSRDRDRRNP